MIVAGRSQPETGSQPFTPKDLSPAPPLKARIESQGSLPLLPIGLSPGDWKDHVVRERKCKATFNRTFLALLSAGLHFLSHASEISQAPGQSPKRGRGRTFCLHLDFLVGNNPRLHGRPILPPPRDSHASVSVPTGDGGAQRRC